MMTEDPNEPTMRRLFSAKVDVDGFKDMLEALVRLYMIVEMNEYPDDFSEEEWKAGLGLIEEYREKREWVRALAMRAEGTLQYLEAVDKNGT